MLTLALLTLPASAQDETVDGDVPGLNAQLFRPSIDSKLTLWTDDTVLGPDKHMSWRVLFNYVNDPLIYVDGTGERVELLSDLLTANVMGGFTYWRLRAGVDIPVYLRSFGDSGGETGLGDISLDGIFQILDHDKAPIGLALNGRMGLPTATVTGPLGNRGFGGEIAVVGDWMPIEKLLFAANLGARFQPTEVLENATWDDSFVFRGGVGYIVTDAAGISLDMAGNATFNEFKNPFSVPVEALLGAWGKLPGAPLVLRGGIGTGITAGIGAPKLRTVISVSSVHPAKLPASPPALDTDGDGLLDNADDCVDQAEDLDGYADTDGCPEPTTVRFRFVDQEGVEVPDVSFTLGEAVGTTEMMLDAGELALAAEAEGYTAAAATVSVPTGAPIEIVQVLPYVPALLGIQALDPDGNAVPNAVWYLDGEAQGPVPAAAEPTPVRPGSYRIAAEAEGYLRASEAAELRGDETVTLTLQIRPTTTKVVGAQIDLGDTIYFQTSKSVIKAESFQLLDDVAAILIEHTQIALVRIEGHTDNRGSDADNLALSAARAGAVMKYLIDKGVSAERLESKGYGESKPLDTAQNEAAWSKNRRVDFFIVDEPPATGGE